MKLCQTSPKSLGEGDYLKYIDLLNLNVDKKNVISFVGAGGKTTTMFEIAKEMKSLGKKVLVTTTTKLFFPNKNQYDCIIISKDYDEIISTVIFFSGKIITVICNEIIYTNEYENKSFKKIKGIEKDWISRFYNEDIFDAILVEADGAKGKLVKAPAIFEPVIPKETNIVVGIIGFGCYGKPINQEWVHRPELFAKIAGKSLGDAIDSESLVNLITSTTGIFKDAPKNSKRIVLLNVRDSNAALEEQAEIVAKLALAKSRSSLVKITDVVINTYTSI